MKTLFFGGAFNPPTKAHLLLAEELMETFSFEKVLFVPTKSKYILDVEKKDSSFSEEQRYKMLLALTETHQSLAVSDIEIRSKEQPRTYFTLRKLKEQGYDLTLMLGSDWLKSLKTAWMYIDEILAEFPLLVIVRNHDDVERIIDEDPYLKERKSHFHIYTPKQDFQRISSSEVRSLLPDFEKNKSKIQELVPEEVFRYMEENRR